MAPDRSSRRGWQRLLSRQILEVAALGVALYAVSALAVGEARVVGVSMNPALGDGNLLLLDKVSYAVHQPARGDVIVFAEPGTGTAIIKRVIGLPGDAVQMSTTYVDPRFPAAGGHPAVLLRPHNAGPWLRLEEPYLQGTWVGGPNDICCDADGHVSSQPAPAVVPAHAYFVLGDNRDNSRDSRFIGFIPASAIIGRAALCIFPVSCWSLVGEAPGLEAATFP